MAIQLSNTSDVICGFCVHPTHFLRCSFNILIFAPVIVYNLCDCRNGKRGQGWERKYVVLDGTKVSVFEIEPREGILCFHSFATQWKFKQLYCTVQANNSNVSANLID